MCVYEFGCMRCTYGDGMIENNYTRFAVKNNQSKPYKSQLHHEHTHIDRM